MFVLTLASLPSPPHARPQVAILYLGLRDTSDDTAFDAALVYGSIVLSLITVAMAVSEKTLHLMDADPGMCKLAAVYLCYSR